MNKILTTFLLVFFFFSNYSFAQQDHSSRNYYKIKATYTPYHTALGKGKGIIFRVNVNTGNQFTVDSFYVNSKPMKFFSKKNSTGVSIESNYLKNKKEPKKGETTVNEPEEIKDELIIKKKFHPSWLIITENGKQKKLRIKKFNLVASKEY